MYGRNNKKLQFLTVMYPRSVFTPALSNPSVSRIGSRPAATRTWSKPSKTSPFSSVRVSVPSASFVTDWSRRKRQEQVTGHPQWTEFWDVPSRSRPDKKSQDPTSTTPFRYLQQQARKECLKWTPPETRIREGDEYRTYHIRALLALEAKPSRHRWTTLLYHLRVRVAKDVETAHDN